MGESLDARPVLLLHYGEIGLKGLNRPRFERQLQERLLEGLRTAGLGARIRYGGGRYVVEPDAAPDDAEAWQARALDVVRRIPGIANVAAALAVAPTLEAMREAAIRLLSRAPAGTFKVETRRGDKTFPMTSIEVSQAVAPALARGTGRRADVRAPDVVVRLELTKDRAFVAAGRLPGAGGLPVGATGRLLAFLSGGIDSPVAAWMMLRRGARVTAVHFHNRTFQGNAVLEKIEDLCGVLAWSAGKLPLAVVPFESSQRAIVATVPAPLRMIVYRRMMLRIGAALARRAKAQGFVTGDCLGQVASQTVENLRVIHQAATLPVHAPLIGMDKAEIMQRARAIGTYGISERPHEDCCSFLVARHPVTRARLAVVEAAEAPLDLPALVTEAVDGTEHRIVLPR